MSRQLVPNLLNLNIDSVAISSSSISTAAFFIQGHKRRSEIDCEGAVSKAIFSLKWFKQAKESNRLTRGVKSQYCLGDVWDSLLFSEIEMLNNSSGRHGKHGEAEAQGCTPS